MRRLAKTAAFLGVFAVSTRAAAVEINVDCARLGQKDAEELRARARLTVKNAKKLPRSLLFACDGESSQVVWDGPPLELIRVKDDASLLEAFLDALEARTRITGRVVRGTEPNRIPPPTPGETPTWEEPQEAPPPETPALPNGGFGLALAIETTGEPLGPQIGPKLDVALGKNPFAMTIWESARLGRARDRYDTFLFDVGAGVAWGAPFNSGYPVGAVVGGGLEWFSVASSTQSTATLAAGLRGAVTVSPFALWLGVDGRRRFTPESAGELVDVKVPRYSLIVSIGVVLLVEGGWKLGTSDEGSGS